MTGVGTALSSLFPFLLLLILGPTHRDHVIKPGSLLLGLCRHTLKGIKVSILHGAAGKHCLSVSNLILLASGCTALSGAVPSSPGASYGSGLEKKRGKEFITQIPVLI